MAKYGYNDIFSKKLISPTADEKHQVRNTG